MLMRKFLLLFVVLAVALLSKTTTEAQQHEEGDSASSSTTSTLEQHQEEASGSEAVSDEQNPTVTDFHSLETRLTTLDYLVSLTDVTFEHETQASTGQTTGSWLVYFHTDLDPTVIFGEVPDPSFWSEHHIVLAETRSSDSYQTRKRFKLGGTGQSLPVFLYLHKGKAYKLKTPPGGYTWEILKRFVTEDYQYTKGADIPPEFTMWDELYDFIEGEVGGDSVKYFGMVGSIFAVMSVLAIINQMKIRREMKSNKEKKE